MLPTINILAIGHDKRGATRQLVDDYCQRCRPAPVIKTFESKGDPRREKAWLASQLTDHYVIGLDSTGTSLTSLALANVVQRQANDRRSITIMIGGSEGLDDDLRGRADLLLSFGAITLPHLLARVVVCEQLYRVQCILSGHPYHK